MSTLIFIMIGLLLFCLPGALLVEMCIRSHESYATQEARRARRKESLRKLRGIFYG